MGRKEKREAQPHGREAGDPVRWETGIILFLSWWPGKMRDRYNSFEVVCITVNKFSSISSKLYGKLCYIQRPCVCVFVCVHLCLCVCVCEVEGWAPSLHPSQDKLQSQNKNAEAAEGCDSWRWLSMVELQSFWSPNFSPRQREFRECIILHAFYPVTHPAPGKNNWAA